MSHNTPQLPIHQIPFIIRRSRLKDLVGLSPSAVDRLEAAGDFPKRRRFSEAIVGYLGSEVYEWCQRKAKG